jgi:HlyD family secretion protein
MRVETRVDEADIGRVRVGQSVRFRVDAYSEQDFFGKVHKIHMAPETIQNVVTYNVLVDAQNPDLLLLPWMTALVRIAVAEHSDALLLPNAALRFSPPADWLPQEPPAAGNSRVWRFGEDGPAPVEVRLGPSDQEATVVLEGELRAGDRVIVGLGGA